MANNFDFNIYIYDKSNKLLAANSGETSGLVTYYETTETVGVFPEFVARIYGADLSCFSNLDEIKIKFVSDLKKYEVESTILLKEHLPNEISLVIKGYFTKKELLLETKTRFLGNTTKEAIDTLGFSQKLHLKTNISARYHQIQESAVKALLRICDCEADIPFWSIGIQDIILSKDNKTESFIPMTSLKNIIETTLPKVDIIDENYDNVYYSSSLNSFQILGNKDNYNAIPKSILNNYLRIRYRPNLIINGSVEGNFPYDLGTVMKNTMIEYKAIKTWTITSIVTKCDQQKLKYDLQYSSWDILEL